MSFRIDHLVETANEVVLRLSGRIETQALDALQQLLDGEKRKIAVDLKEVSLIGSEAVAFFALCENGGIEIRNCPNYVREWINREGPPDRKRRARTNRLKRQL